MSKDTKISKSNSDEFEDLAYAIVNYLFEESSVRVERTRRCKDGGYDVVVDFEQGDKHGRIYFECKLRSSNLGIRDIAANVIIAFNRGAVAFVAVTNHNFTEQTGAELVSFAQKAPLEIRVMLGDDVSRLIEPCGFNITDSLSNLIFLTESNRAQDFQLLRIDLDDRKSLPKLFRPKGFDSVLEIEAYCTLMGPSFIADAVETLSTGHTLIIRSYPSFGKDRFVDAVARGTGFRRIDVNASMYDTQGSMLIDLFKIIWGIDEKQILDSLSKEDCEDIFSILGDEAVNSKTKSTLAMLLRCEDNRIVDETFNKLVIDYLVSLISLRSNNARYMFTVRKLQYASTEIYCFLIYLIKRFAHEGVACVITIDKDEYTMRSQQPEDPLDDLRWIDKADLIELPPLSRDKLKAYLMNRNALMTDHLAETILNISGCRLDTVDQAVAFMQSRSEQSGIPFEVLANEMVLAPADDPSSKAAVIIYSWEDTLGVLFDIAYLLDLRVPVEIADKMSVPLDLAVGSGLFECSTDMLVPSSIFISEYIMATRTNSAHVIRVAHMVMRETKSGPLSVYVDARIRALYASGYYEEILQLFDSEIEKILKQKELTRASKLVKTAISATEKLFQPEKEVEYLILQLQIFSVRKRVWTNEYKASLALFERKKRLVPSDQKIELASIYFQAKLSMREEKYGAEEPAIIALKNTYNRCVSGNIRDNPEDFLGWICSQYALVIKRRFGNERAFDAYKLAMRALPHSFELTRGFLSHVACMHLFDDPKKSYRAYNRIRSMFTSHPERLGRPFHEYGDLSMSLLLMHQFEDALEEAEEAIRICDANGAIEETGRALNIAGCAHWCMNQASIALKEFLEASSLLEYSGYLAYAWRSELNAAVILCEGDDRAKESREMLQKAFDHFHSSLGERVCHLAQNLDSVSFARTREYHALIVFYSHLHLLQTTCSKRQAFFKLFHLQDHASLFDTHVRAYEHGKESFMASPFLSKSVLFMVG